MNKKEVQFILRHLNFTPKKKFGQNFLINSKVLRKIISEANLNENDIVVEIGAGLGALTSELILNAKKVYSYEINSTLFQYLLEKFSDFSNIELINQDILKIQIPYHNKAVSNIPYTLTGPIFEKIFYNEQPPEGVFIIEKSIADRIFLSGTYKDFSRITVTFNAFMKPLKKQIISSNCFYPSPKIELALIKVIPREKVNPFLVNKENINFFLRFIAGIMPYKNKNLVNALALYFKNNSSFHFTKIELLEFLKEFNIQNKKLFQFNADDLIDICAQIFNWLKY
ncbi:MAG: 16S rRNA (adenine(1518)-N(6)/adenine(1519)-N(6))-dimethyltransferase RsmA [Candidatus Hermodarchaeota archaeon]